jgi:hypothetical protein
MARRRQLLGSEALSGFFGSASPWILLGAGVLLAVRLLSRPGSGPNKASGAMLQKLPGVRAINAVKGLLASPRPSADLPGAPGGSTSA